MENDSYEKEKAGRPEPAFPGSARTQGALARLSRARELRVTIGAWAPPTVYASKVNRADCAHGTHLAH